MIDIIYLFSGIAYTIVGVVTYNGLLQQSLMARPPSRMEDLPRVQLLCLIGSALWPLSIACGLLMLGLAQFNGNVSK